MLRNFSKIAKSYPIATKNYTALKTRARNESLIDDKL